MTSFGCQVSKVSTKNSWMKNTQFDMMLDLKSMSTMKYTQTNETFCMDEIDEKKTIVHRLMNHAHFNETSFCA
jgi:hypothetical protein